MPLNAQDKGGRRVALRPELTPSLARLVLSAGAGRPLPLKWAAVGQCWRYERSTRGRRREHYQWNLDVVGVAGVEAEAELLAALVAFFRRVGLGPADVGIRVSTRALLGAVLEGAGVPAAAHPAIYVAVDRADKLPIAAVEAELGALRVPPAAIDALLRTLRIRDVGALSEVLPPDSPAARDLVVLFDLAAAYGIADWLHFDAGVVRGLAYYTGIVFEGFDRAGALRAVCGGGRYDRLLSSLGGADLPCAGFGFGDAVIVELLRDRGLLPDLGRRVDDVVHALEESLRPQACAAAAALRAKGRSVELVLEPKRMKWVLKVRGNGVTECGGGRDGCDSGDAALKQPLGIGWPGSCMACVHARESGAVPALVPSGAPPFPLHDSACGAVRGSEAGPAGARGVGQGGIQGQGPVQPGGEDGSGGGGAVPAGVSGACLPPCCLWISSSLLRRRFTVE